MPNLLGRLIGLSFRGELLMMNILGLINSTLDWSPIKWTTQLERIWNLSLSQQSLILDTVGEDTIKIILSWIVITRIIIAHVYTFTYVANIYSILTWSRPNLLLPWMVLSFFKNVILEVIVIVIGLLLWYGQRFSVLLFFEFIFVKVVPLILAIYNWYSNSCLYLQLKHTERLKKLRRTMKSESNLSDSRLLAKIDESFHKYRTMSLTTLISSTSRDTDDQDTIFRIVDDLKLTPGEKTMKILGITEQDVLKARERRRERLMMEKLTERSDDVSMEEHVGDVTLYFSLEESQDGVDVYEKRDVTEEKSSDVAKKRASSKEDISPVKVSAKGRIFLEDVRRNKEGSSKEERKEKIEELTNKDVNREEMGEESKSEDKRRMKSKDLRSRDEKKEWNEELGRRDGRRKRNEELQGTVEKRGCDKEKRIKCSRPRKEEIEYSGRPCSTALMKRAARFCSMKPIARKSFNNTDICCIKQNVLNSNVKKDARDRSKRIETDGSFPNADCSRKEHIVDKRSKENIAFNSNVKEVTMYQSLSGQSRRNENYLSFTANCFFAEIEQNVPFGSIVNKDTALRKSLDPTRKENNNLSLAGCLSTEMKHNLALNSIVQKDTKHGTLNEFRKNGRKDSMIDESIFQEFAPKEEDENWVKSSLKNFYGKRSKIDGDEEEERIHLDLESVVGLEANLMAGNCNKLFVKRLHEHLGMYRESEEKNSLIFEDNLEVERSQDETNASLIDFGSALFDFQKLGTSERIKDAIIGESSSQKKTLHSCAKIGKEKDLSSLEFCFVDANVPWLLKNVSKVFDGCYEKDFAKTEEMRFLHRQMERRNWNFFSDHLNNDHSVDREDKVASQDEDTKHDKFMSLEAVAPRVPKMHDFDKQDGYRDTTAKIASQAKEAPISNAQTDELCDHHKSSTLNICECSSTKITIDTHTQTEKRQRPKKIELNSITVKKRRSCYHVKRKCQKKEENNPLSSDHKSYDSRYSLLNVNVPLSKTSTKPSYRPVPSRHNSCVCTGTQNESIFPKGAQDYRSTHDKAKLESFGTLSLARTTIPSGFEKLAVRGKPPMYLKRSELSSEAKKRMTKKPVDRNVKQSIDKLTHSLFPRKNEFESMERRNREMKALKAYNKITLQEDKRELEARRKDSFNQRSSQNSVKDGKLYSYRRTNKGSRNSQLSEEVVIYDEYLDKDCLLASIDTDESTSSVENRISVSVESRKRVQPFNDSNDNYPPGKLTRVDKLSEKLKEVDARRLNDVRSEKSKRAEEKARTQRTKCSNPKKNLSASSSKRFKSLQKAQELERIPTGEDVREKSVISVGLVNQGRLGLMETRDDEGKVSSDCSVIFEKEVVKTLGSAIDLTEEMEEGVQVLQLESGLFMEKEEAIEVLELERELPKGKKGLITMLEDGRNNSKEEEALDVLEAGVDLSEREKELKKVLKLGGYIAKKEQEPIKVSEGEAVVSREKEELIEILELLTDLFKKVEELTKILESGADIPKGKEELKEVLDLVADLSRKQEDSAETLELETDLSKKKTEFLEHVVDSFKEREELTELLPLKTDSSKEKHLKESLNDVINVSLKKVDTEVSEYVIDTSQKHEEMKTVLEHELHPFERKEDIQNCHTEILAIMKFIRNRDNVTSSTNITEVKHKCPAENKENNIQIIERFKHVDKHPLQTPMFIENQSNVTSSSDRFNLPEKSHTSNTDQTADQMELIPNKNLPLNPQNPRSSKVPHLQDCISNFAAVQTSLKISENGTERYEDPSEETKPRNMPIDLREITRNIHGNYLSNGGFLTNKNLHGEDVHIDNNEDNYQRDIVDDATASLLHNAFFFKEELILRTFLRCPKTEKSSFLRDVTEIFYEILDNSDQFRSINKEFVNQPSSEVDIFTDERQIAISDLQNDLRESFNTAMRDLSENEEENCDLCVITIDREVPLKENNNDGEELNDEYWMNSIVPVLKDILIKFNYRGFDLENINGTRVEILQEIFSDASDRMELSEVQCEGRSEERNRLKYIEELFTHTNLSTGGKTHWMPKDFSLTKNSETTNLTDERISTVDNFLDKDEVQSDLMHENFISLNESHGPLNLFGEVKLMVDKAIDKRCQSGLTPEVLSVLNQITGTPNLTNEGISTADNFSDTKDRHLDLTPEDFVSANENPGLSNFTNDVISTMDNFFNKKEVQLDLTPEGFPSFDQNLGSSNELRSKSDTSLDKEAFQIDLTLEALSLDINSELENHKNCEASFNVIHRIPASFRKDIENGNTSLNSLNIININSSDSLRPLDSSSPIKSSAVNSKVYLNEGIKKEKFDEEIVNAKSFILDGIKEEVKIPDLIEESNDDSEREDGIDMEIENFEDEQFHESVEKEEEISLKMILSFWMIVFLLYVRYFYEKVRSFANPSKSTNTLRPFDIHTTLTSTSSLLNRPEMREVKEDDTEEDTFRDNKNVGKFILEKVDTSLEEDEYNFGEESLVSEEANEGGPQSLSNNETFEVLSKEEGVREECFESGLSEVALEVTPLVQKEESRKDSYSSLLNETAEGFKEIGDLSGVKKETSAFEITRVNSEARSSLKKAGKRKDSHISLVNKTSENFSEERNRTGVGEEPSGLEITQVNSEGRSLTKKEATRKQSHIFLVTTTSENFSEKEDESPAKEKSSTFGRIEVASEESSLPKKEEKSRDSYCSLLNTSSDFSAPEFGAIVSKLMKLSLGDKVRPSKSNHENKDFDLINAFNFQLQETEIHSENFSAIDLHSVSYSANQSQNGSVLSIENNVEERERKENPIALSSGFIHENYMNTQEVDSFDSTYTRKNETSESTISFEECSTMEEFLTNDSADSTITRTPDEASGNN